MTVALMPIDALPATSRLGKLYREAQAAKARFEAAQAAVAQLTAEQEELRRWLEQARSSTTTPEEFAAQQARAVLIGRDLEEAAERKRAAGADYQRADRRWVEARQEYADLVRRRQEQAATVPSDTVASWDRQIAAWVAAEE
jgi:chromosome segregation ATPase